MLDPIYNAKGDAGIIHPALCAGHFAIRPGSGLASGYTTIPGRGFHSSTSRLNLSHFATETTPTSQRIPQKLLM